jgi:hypothetical protein
VGYQSGVWAISQECGQSVRSVGNQSGGWAISQGGEDDLSVRGQGMSSHRGLISQVGEHEQFEGVRNSTYGWNSVSVCGCQ